MAAEIAKKLNAEVMVFRAREYVVARSGSCLLEDAPDAEGNFATDDVDQAHPPLRQ